MEVKILYERHTFIALETFARHDASGILFELLSIYLVVVWSIGNGVEGVEELGDAGVRVRHLAFHSCRGGEL